MPLHLFQRQYEQLSQFERGGIISMMEAGWSARRVARLLGRSDCVVTSGSERCHLHENQAQDALDRSFVEKTATSTMLGLTQQGCQKTVSTLSLPFLGLPDTQICLQSSIFGIIWDGELDELERTRGKVIANME
ncbi:transposable element Tcb1 transposase [Trichonephila clavipes]|nr:transposable element Tcb1 transposase [Trichonephila clavipes]